MPPCGPSSEAETWTFAFRLFAKQFTYFHLMARLFALLDVSDLGVFAVAFLQFSRSEAPEGAGG